MTRSTLVDKYKHYKMTKDSFDEVTPVSPLYSVDCKMCLTYEGNELTRICVVDSSIAVYHTMVKLDLW